MIKSIQTLPEDQRYVSYCMSANANLIVLIKTRIILSCFIFKLLKWHKTAIRIMKCPNMKQKMTG